ncbi:MAG: hypothetical protein J6K58_11540 [Lachnospiraceae bacterium]|nr:hypothetical protein [Lachnospiraceae bacterium]MBP3459830.1 hypothetical protein [Lachnospiraceae bacterium]
MNTKQKLHQIKLQHWADLFREKDSSGLPAREWCAEKSISIHAYNYWKHQLKREYLESSLSDQHDIIPLTTPASDLPVPENPAALPLSCQSRDSREMYHSISISTGDVLIQASSNVSDEYLLRILKAVRHA